MRYFKTKIEGSEKIYNFKCYECVEPIEIGDKFLFFFAGIADVGECSSESEKEEVNPNNRVRDGKTIDLVTGFWRNCYKIISTTYECTKA